ncbi:MAG: hypothetical protein ACR2MT_01230 [Aurantibacter sp.]
MRTLILLIVLITSFANYGQQDTKISTMDFVQILDDNKEEAIYYFQNNWKVLRNMAIKKGYIHSYEFLEAPISEGAPFQLVFITTYQNQEQYKLREDHFAELIKEKGKLRLMNDKEPDEFRKSLFTKERVRHWK